VQWRWISNPGRLEIDVSWHADPCIWAEMQNRVAMQESVVTLEKMLGVTRHLRTLALMMSGQALTRRKMWIALSEGNERW
jgi:hypothetical protein